MQDFTPYVAAGLADGYSAEDKAYVAGWGDNTPDEVLWAEYEDYSLTPGSEYKNYSVFVVRKPISGQAGSVYPWFDEHGGATQFVLPAKVKDLLEDGSLERGVYR